jgi:hypothetical protein
MNIFIMYSLNLEVQILKISTVKKHLPSCDIINSVYIGYSNHSCTTLQRQNTEISKQIFPERKYRGLSPNFHIHAYVNDLYIPTIGLPILLEEI